MKKIIFYTILILVVIAVLNDPATRHSVLTEIKKIISEAIDASKNNRSSESKSTEIGPTDSNSSIPPLRWPLKGQCSDWKISMKYGESWKYGSCAGLYKKHAGIDIVAGVGENVFSAEAGIVRVIYEASDKGENWGKGIVLDHGAFTTVYLHVDPVVIENQPVKRGQEIATVARTNSIHLHFGVRDDVYADASQRGALPQKKSLENGKCKNDPVFPGKFVDPLMEVTYE
jgi:murein DD-endopeptidase MepM/ murein hydrolase activator NlpD